MKALFFLLFFIGCTKECAVYPTLPEGMCTVSYGETPWALSNIRLDRIKCAEANAFCIKHNERKK